MAFTRSGVRLPLAPPAFARFASFGSASRIGPLGLSERWLPRRSSAGTEAGTTTCRTFQKSLHVKYVYILQSKTGEHFYVGATDDLRARLTKHNAGGVAHTAKFLPWRLKTYVAFSNDKQAFAFEKYLKSPSGRAFSKKRL
jgi:putative endonuclease